MKGITYLFSILMLLLGGCKKPAPLPVEKGVPAALAEYRKSHISNPEYQLFISIPENREEPVTGNEDLIFDLQSTEQDLQIDFREEASKIHSVSCNGIASRYSFEAEHLLIPAGELRKGKNRIRIEFEVGPTSLNRNHEFLYTLFVPDRARTAFPCFDQPDLKAPFTLTMEVPSSWTAMANGKLQEKKEQGDRTTYLFQKTRPLPTYLFSFVSGKFETITREYKGKTYNLFHRETDPEKLKNNVDDIFAMLFSSLDWLETYTGIDYPFAKYDMIAIPSFQYGGMEHTGATLYKARTLFLEKNPSQTQLLSRANLIAHETAHMWFGDLVTMKWFDQVWLKEVFANFMADKIVNPSYPDINHNLKFVMAHFPSAYSVDRTMGANPINQKLDNLKDAGTLYGSIIYHKSPIVMQMLEQITGEGKLREGLQEYLKDFSYGNATWENLISILDAKTEFDLKNWSKVWVDEPERPHLYTELQLDEKGNIEKLLVHQKDDQNKNRIWPQSLSIVLGYENKLQSIPVKMDDHVVEVTEAKGLPQPQYLILNGKGHSYGYFELDETSLNFLLNHISQLDNEVLRGISWINLWENFLNQKLTGTEFIQATLKHLPSEDNALNTDCILGYMAHCYWLDLNLDEQKAFGPKLEQMLWKLMNDAPSAGMKSSYYSSLVSVAETEEMLKKLHAIWEGKMEVKGLHLSEQRLTILACNLSIKMEDQADYILNTQLNRITNPDRKARLEFVMPSLSPDQSVRDSFFESLRKEENREHEPWVTEAVGYLHHPLRRKEALKYILPSLQLLQEIQETGDIFFPKSWLSATYSGHNSSEAARITQDFFETHPDYPVNLKMKILQAADDVLRKAKQ